MSEAVLIPSYNMTEPLMSDTAASQSNSSANSTATDLTQWSSLPSTVTCIYVYSGLMISIVVLITCSVMCFFVMCMRASISLHNGMLSGITQTTMWFFSNNPSGNFGSIGEISILT
jgi:hypothetical protein